MAVSFPENEAIGFILHDSNKRHFIWTLLRCKATNFTIPSWTGFQMSISNAFLRLQTSIGYLDSIDSSAAKISTIQNDQMSSSQTRLKHSITQDIVYTVSNSKVKTPKTLLYPSIIKQLTNNTEIINIVHRLGHSVPYSILNGMHTENAYIVHDQQEKDDVILPLTNEKKHSQTML